MQSDAFMCIMSTNVRQKEGNRQTSFDCGTSKNVADLNVADLKV